MSALRKSFQEHSDQRDFDTFKQLVIHQAQRNRNWAQPPEFKMQWENWRSRRWREAKMRQMINNENWDWRGWGITKATTQQQRPKERLHTRATTTEAHDSRKKRLSYVAMKMNSWKQSKTGHEVRHRKLPRVLWRSKWKSILLVPTWERILTSEFELRSKKQPVHRHKVHKRHCTDHWHELYRCIKGKWWLPWYKRAKRYKRQTCICCVCLLFFCPLRFLSDL